MKKVVLLLVGISLCLAYSAFAQKRGGTVVGPVITTVMIKNFNPFTQNVNKSVPGGFMYETLLVYNFRNNKIDYLLATGFEYSKDLMSITYNIRKGVKWSDGKPLTADDVVFSHKMAQKNSKVDVQGLYVTDNPKIKNIVKVDSHTVRFELTKVDTTIEWLIPLMYVVPKHIWASVKDPAEFKNENPVGSGVFTKVKRFNANQVTVCRNPHYWDAPKPYVDCLRLRQFQGNDQIQAALIRGEIDWGSNFIPDIEKTFVAKDPKNNKFWYPAGCTVPMILNNDKKPMDDLKFRQAFSMALDRKNIVDLATYGYATENPHITGIGDFFGTWYNDEINKKYDYLNQYNPKAANKLLDEAGYKDQDGDGFRDLPDGTPIKINMMVVGGWTDWVQTVQMISDQLKDVGIKGKTRTVEWGQYAEGFTKRTFDAGILWSGTGVSPYRFYEPILRSTSEGKLFEGGHGFNSPEIDALLDSYTKTGDKVEQKKIIDQLQEIFAANLPIIPIFSNPTWYQYSTKRFVGWPTAENPYINPNFYDVGDRVIMIKNIHKK